MGLTSSTYDIVTPLWTPNLADAFNGIVGYAIVWINTTDCPNYLSVKEDIGCLQLTALTLS